MKKGLKNIKGTGVALITPFKKSGAIDFDACEKILDHVIDGGVDFVVILGTTVEASTLSKQEKKALIEFSVLKVNHRVPVVVGIGGNSTSDVVLNIHATPFKDIAAILSVSPYYNKPQQEGIYLHFKTIAEASPVPVILYTVPGRTGSNISASTTIRLACEVPNILGIKEASGNFDQIYQVIKNKPKDFLVFSGDDGLTLPLLSAGADGVISVVANAYPRIFSEMVRKGLKGEFEEARELHYRLIDLINTLFLDGSPSGIKAGLNIMGLCQNLLRLPLVPVKKDVYKQIKWIIDNMDHL